MPALIRTTFAFAGFEQGWSEDFYYTPVNADLNIAETVVTPIAQKRAACLADGYTLTVIKNTLVRYANNTPAKRVTDLIEPRLKGVSTWKPATPNLCLMCVWQSQDNLASKKQYMRGIPADLGETGKAPNKDMPGWLTNFNAWRSSMVALNAGWMVTEATAPNTAVITTYTANPDTGEVQFFLQAPGITFPKGPGFRVRVYVSLPGKSPLDGSIVVVPSSPTTVTTVEPIGVQPAVPGLLGIMQLRTATFQPITPAFNQNPPGQIHPQRIISHKTGRPLFASRGRALARPKW